MSDITIEGSRVTPSTFLAPGRRITVERTLMVEKMIRKGFVIEVDIHESALADPAPETAEGLDENSSDSAPAQVSVPAETAAKSVWAAFLGKAEISYPADATKPQMIEIWNNRGVPGNPVD